MSKRIGLLPTATVERLRKGEPTWVVGLEGFAVQYPPDWYETTAEVSTYRDMIRLIKGDQFRGYREFATLEEAERYAARLRGKDKT